jgi:hypothetical protein
VCVFPRGAFQAGRTNDGVAWRGVALRGVAWVDDFYFFTTHSAKHMKNDDFYFFT